MFSISKRAMAALTILLALGGCVRLIPVESQQANAAREPMLHTGDGYRPVPRPVWDGGRVVPNAVRVEGGTYIVRDGDTLRGIGNRTGAGSEVIAIENGLVEPWTVYPGQRLKIPSGRYHTVGPGDTGIAIAQAYGVRWLDIVQLNDLEAPYILRMGQRLRLPTNSNAADGDAALRARAKAFDIGIADIVSGSQPAIAEGARPEAALPAGSPAEVPLSSAVQVPERFGGSFRWPLSGQVVQGFGTVAEGRKNEGIDIAAPVGATVGAAESGTVIYAGQGVGAVGGLVLVDHGEGWVTAYGRLGDISVVRGNAVQKGQRLGRVGDTGYGAGPNLHFEIRQKLKPVDPLPLLGKR